MRIRKEKTEPRPHLKQALKT